MRSSLNLLLANMRLSNNARRVFVDWPALEDTALRFLQYVSPWLIVDGANLAEVMLQRAIAEYEAAPSSEEDVRYRRFLVCLAGAAQVLRELRISVKNKNEQWAVWSYDEPLMTYLARHNRTSLQIRRRDIGLPVTPVLIKLLASIGSTDELIEVESDIARLMAQGSTS